MQLILFKDNKIKSQKLEKEDILFFVVALPLYLFFLVLISKFPHYMINEHDSIFWLWVLHPLGYVIYIVVALLLFQITAVLLAVAYDRLRDIEHDKKSTPEYIDVKLSLVTKILIGIFAIILIRVFYLLVFS